MEIAGTPGIVLKYYFASTTTFYLNVRNLWTCSCARRPLVAVSGMTLAACIRLLKGPFIYHFSHTADEVV